ncbi:signal peptidase 22 kDa subunit [Gonapodya prolifera JEL478]|uniref:Signal peptidase subunit 3 n=1 Tax=Gonapodya prolifera (strain JEL478) TaxID=1344416 RepID=A0A139A9J0_GONPJ|nr:signal peptidase 22 kDa subunit [Gonapodya prolifera JEL478]|eukprot:KXS13492.1 signal peptidase 22 kDa subunit [Gonapodya prolifera JEL478]
MYSISQRANAVLAFLVTVTLGFLVAVALTSPILLHGKGLRPAPGQNVLKIVDAESHKARLAFYDRTQNQSGDSELAIIRFDISADLRDLWNWNTKQLFVYVVAEYETDSHSTNQVVIWDSIIRNKDDALIRLRNVKGEYFLVDINPTLSTVSAKFTLHWNIIPYVGALFWNSGGQTPILALPAPR